MFTYPKVVGGPPIIMGASLARQVIYELIGTALWLYGAPASWCVCVSGVEEAGFADELWVRATDRNDCPHCDLIRHPTPQGPSFFAVIMCAPYEAAKFSEKS